jgi:hypothetical protein
VNRERSIHIPIVESAANNANATTSPSPAKPEENQLNLTVPFSRAAPASLTVRVRRTKQPRRLGPLERGVRPYHQMKPTVGK